MKKLKRKLVHSKHVNIKILRNTKYFRKSWMQMHWVLRSQ